MSLAAVALLVAAGTTAGGAGSGLCGFCHPDVRVKFEESIHHIEEVACTSCHGGDAEADTVERAHRGRFRKPSRREEIPVLCGSCHSDPGKMRPYNLPTDQLALYRTSQHGRALERGNERAAVCTDCHGVHGTLAPSDPRSRVHPRNIPSTCAVCHSDAELMAVSGHEGDPLADFLAGLHGRALVERADESAPECARCHGAHGAAPPGIGDVNKVCGHCHATARAHFLESPHRAGMEAAGLAECSSCHGHHRIVLAGVGELESVCQSCHDPGTPQAELGLQMKTLYLAASEELEKAAASIAEAERVPLYVEDYTARLEEAHTSLVEAATAMHSLDLDLVDRLTSRARSIGQEVESEVHHKLDGLKWRRVGLLVFWFYLLVTMATLVHFRRGALRAVSGEPAP